jgi:ATP-dependent Zn protease
MAAFCISCVFVAVMVWRLHQANSRSESPIAYQKFLELVDTGKIQDATIYAGFDLAQVRASLRDGSKSIQSDVPTKDLATLVKQMMDKGASVQFSTSHRFDASSFFLDIAPYLFVVVFAIVLMRRKARP